LSDFAQAAFKGNRRAARVMDKAMCLERF